MAAESSIPRISSLLIKPVSALCNQECAYCFYLDRAGDPYQPLPARSMTTDTLERLVDTYLFYSYPASVFAFQGGEPTLAGCAFYEKLVRLQQQYGRNGQMVSNSMQTNGLLLDDRWCDLFREYKWLVGVSMDGPEEVHNLYRRDRGGKGVWRQVVKAIELMQKHGVDFNALCVVSQANVNKAAELYRYFRSMGAVYIQYIPLAEFDAEGRPLPFAITPEQYGRFLCETFDAWWPDRRKLHIRCFDDLAVALAGQRPGACTMLDSCDSYAVVEFNGDVYPCDFFVEKDWKLGNIELDSWAEIARRRRRFEFAAKKSIGQPACLSCEYQTLCRNGCPKHRYDPHHRFEDLDYFCPAYKTVFAKVLAPLGQELQRLVSLAGPGPA